MDQFVLICIKKLTIFLYHMIALLQPFYAPNRLRVIIMKTVIIIYLFNPLPKVVIQLNKEIQSFQFIIATDLFYLKLNL